MNDDKKRRKDMDDYIGITLGTCFFLLGGISLIGLTGAMALVLVKFFLTLFANIWAWEVDL